MNVSINGFSLQCIYSENYYNLWFTKTQENQAYSIQLRHWWVIHSWEHRWILSIQTYGEKSLWRYRICEENAIKLKRGWIQRPGAGRANTWHECYYSLPSSSFSPTQSPWTYRNHSSLMTNLNGVSQFPT